jgi:hypothetical protein
MRSMLRTLLVTLLMGMAVPATAQFAIEPTLKVYPYESNVWFDPAFGGSGWTISWISVPSIPSGRLGSFGFYTYDAAGRATWLSYQHPYTATPISGLVQGGLVGQMAGDLLEFRGGPTPTGPATTAASSVSPLGAATLRWVSPTVIEASYGGVTRRLIPGEFAVGLQSVPAILEGRWTAQARVRDGTFECRFRLVRTAVPGVNWVPLGNPRELPQQGSEWLEAIDELDSPPCFRDWRFEYRPSTQVVRMWLLSPGLLLPDLSGYQIGEGGFGPVVVQSPRRVLAWISANRAGDGTVFREYEFTKLP